MELGQVDLRVVCERLTITIRKGRIACPNAEHEEHHADNCQIRHTKAGGWRFRCYVCGSWGSALDLVELRLGLTKAQAFDWLRQAGFLDEETGPVFSVMTKAEYERWLDAYMQADSRRKIDWVLVKAYEWERLGIPYRSRVREMIAFSKKANQLDRTDAAVQAKVQAWERTGEGVDYEKIERRLKIERKDHVFPSMLLNSRSEDGRLQNHEDEPGIRGY